MAKIIIFNVTIFGNFKGLFCIWQSFEPTLASFFEIGQISIVTNAKY